MPRSLLDKSPIQERIFVSKRVSAWLLEQNNNESERFSPSLGFVPLVYLLRHQKIGSIQKAGSLTIT